MQKNCNLVRTSIFRELCHVIPPEPDTLFALRCVGSLRYSIAIGHAVTNDLV